MSKQIRNLDRTCATMKVDMRNGLNDARNALISELKAQSAALHTMKTTLGKDKSQCSHTGATKAYYSSLQSIPIQIQNLSQQAGIVASSQRILKSLQFDKMHDREDQIQEAYGKTFDWIFADDATCFKKWLLSGSGAFWVNGKAGSGKSTLMKFLAHHSETKQLLHRWAGNERLVFVTHFFWSSGLGTQKSRLGLLQSFVYQILRQCPELIPGASSRRWEADFLDDFDRWTHTELILTLETILAQGRLTSRFCFFVDGLDEYAGDQFAMIQDFDRLLQSPQVKFCVSSRPWNVFRERYGSNKEFTLTLEDLTLADMHEYVQGMLEGDKRFCRLANREPEALTLITRIRDRAEGVFLWVFLVLRSLLRGLDEQDDTKELEQRLEQMPSDLDAYFRKIVDTIDPTYRVATVRAFQLATIAVPMPLMVFRYISSELENKRYAFGSDVVPLRQDEINASNERARTLVNKWCRDLLEVKWGYHEEISDFEERVYFLHRTVKDFLMSQEMQDEFWKHPTSHPHLRQAVCMMHLAQTKALSECTTERKLRSFERSVDNVMHWAAQCEEFEGITPHEILEELSRVRHIVRDRTPNWSIWSQHPDSILHHAVRWPLPLFVAQSLERRPRMKSGILAYALLPKLDERGRLLPPHQPHAPMITLLLENGIDPNDAWTSRLSRSTTAWQHFLRQCYHRQAGNLWQAAEIMLEYGADPNITVEMPLDGIYSQQIGARACLHHARKQRPELDRVLEEAAERAAEHLAQLPFHMRITGTLFRSVDTAFETTIGLLCLGSCKEKRGYRRLGPDEAAWHLTDRCT